MLSLFLKCFLGIFVCAMLYILYNLSYLSYIMCCVKEPLLWIKRPVHHEISSTEPEKLKCDAVQRST